MWRQRIESDMREHGAARDGSRLRAKRRRYIQARARCCARSARCSSGVLIRGARARARCVCAMRVNRRRDARAVRPFQKREVYRLLRLIACQYRSLMPPAKTKNDDGIDITALSLITGHEEISSTITSTIFHMRIRGQARELLRVHFFSLSSLLH